MKEKNSCCCNKDKIKELEKFNVVIDATLAHDRLSRLSTLLLSGINRTLYS